ncbi:MAG: glycosyltransferase [Bacteroidales bacterium]|nr:glycosyltransferase [Bacteroidales bacterium]
MISAIVCTYNREKYLPDCLESIVNQTLDNDRFEIILINNNSTDNTEPICYNFIKEHPKIRIKYFTERNQGISFARNLGINESSGEYITFIDDDATLDKSFLKEVVDFMNSNREVSSVGGKILLNYESEKPNWMTSYLLPLLGYFNYGEKIKAFDKKKYPHGSNMTFRKEIFDKYGGFDVSLGRKGDNLEGNEEKELFYRLYNHNKIVCYLPDAVVYHAVPDSRITNEFIKRQAIGIGLSEWNRINKRNKEKYSRIIEELLKWVVSVGLFFYYSIILKPAKGAMIIRFRWWVTKGLFHIKGCYD